MHRFGGLHCSTSVLDFVGERAHELSEVCVVLLSILSFCFQVLDFTAYSTQTEYLLRLKTAEGWVTGASIQLMQLPNGGRCPAANSSSCEAFSSKSRSQQSGEPTTGAAAGLSNHHQAGDPGALFKRGKSCGCSGGASELEGSQLGTDIPRQVDESLSSTCWSTVNACRATRVCSFQVCVDQQESRASFTNLSKLAPALAIQSFGTALLHKVSGGSSASATAEPQNLGVCGTLESLPLNDGQSAQNTITGGLSPKEHPFILFCVSSSRPVPVR